MNFLPAPAGTGIIFRRIDLEGQPEIPATVDFVCDTARSTTIASGSARVHTVEHVLAALKAYKVDNLIIELSSLEPPVADGSSLPFIEMIEQVGVVEQEGEVAIMRVKEPLYFSSEKGIHLVALPSDVFCISYTLSYPHTPVLSSQFHSEVITPLSFKEAIAPCRTFSLYEEVSALMDRGLIKGGSLDNAVIIKGDVVFSKGGLRFDNEMVRHKILDMVGDFSLVGYDFLAHVIAIRSGHDTNVTFARQLRNAFIKEKVACQNH